MVKGKPVRIRPKTLDKLWKIKGELGGQPFDRIIDKLITEKYDHIFDNGKKKQKGFPWQIK